MTIPLWYPYKWYQIGYYAQSCIHAMYLAPDTLYPSQMTTIPRVATSDHIWPTYPAILSGHVIQIACITWLSLYDTHINGIRQDTMQSCIHAMYLVPDTLYSTQIVSSHITSPDHFTTYIQSSTYRIHAVSAWICLCNTHNSCYYACTITLHSACSTLSGVCYTHRIHT